MHLPLRQVAQRVKMPALFLIVCVFAFGLQIPWLGFYLDDWIILNAYNLGGAERLFEYAFLGNRPLVFWLWWIGFKLFGSAPIYWHIWALLWRWLTVVILWAGWRELWPRAPRQIAIAGLLFAVYPLFKQQATALTYSFHWICFFLYGLSIYLMIKSVRAERYFYPLMLGAVAAGFIQLFSQEFYTGLELLRPVVIWLALEGLIPDWKNRLKRTFFYWAPYLLILALYLVWRLALMPTPGSDRNAPGLMYGLFTTPLQSLVELATFFAQDLAEMLVGVWYQTVQPGLFTPSPLANLVAWALVGITCLLLLGFFKLWRPQPELSHSPAGLPAKPWYQTAIPFGFLAMILGFAPGWSIGRHIYDLSGMYNDRFGLAAMFGASILVVGLIEMLLRKESYRIVLACLLVALATGQNFRVTTNYRWSWEKQLRLYWQLKWRVPEIQPQTAILGEGALISYIGSWATISAFMQMYAPEDDVHFVDYWYYDISKIGLKPHIEDNQPIRDEKNFMRFDAPAQNSLVITFKPDEQQCLWVLSDRDQANRYLTEKERDALPLSNPSRILPVSDRTLRADIFGADIPHDWCYYFEKGDLARQFEDWDEVVRLWQEAEQKGVHPRVGIEYGPFIEGFARSGDFEQALNLTRKAYYPDYVMRNYLCQAWERIGQSAEDSPELRDALQHAVDDFGCEENILQ